MKNLFILLICSVCARGATYFIDFDNGSDANAGTTQTVPWKTLPGTRKPDNSGYVSVSYGGTTFTYNANKVPAGTIFKLKRGTTLKGGWIQMDSLWYGNGSASSPITIQADTTWGSGSIVISGTGVTMPSYRGLLNLDSVKYLVIDGGAPSGIVVRNTTWNGIRAYDTDGLTLKNVEVANGPVALVSVFSSKGSVPTYVSDVMLDNIIAHDTTGTEDTSSCIYGSWLNNFTIKNCTTYNSGKGADGIHVESSHSGWIMNCVAHNCGEQGIDLSRNGSYKTRDDSFNITVRECISYDNSVNNFDHNSGTHHVLWLNCFAWRTTSGELGDPCFNVHQGSAGPNWWINCSSARSMSGGLIFGWSANQWGIPAGTYPQYVINFTSSGDSTHVSPSRIGSVGVDNDVTGCVSVWQFVNSIFNTDSPNNGVMNVKGTIYSAANVATGSGGWPGINCSVVAPMWQTPNATSWALSNETPVTGSPCLNRGVWVFKTASSGSGTSIALVNSYGLDAARVFRAGDAVQLEGGGAMRVVSVASPGTLIVDQSVTWVASKGVWFNSGGSAPQIGAAFQSTDSTPDKFTLTVINGIGTGNYTSGTVVAIAANAASPGSTFKTWTGAAVAVPSAANTTLTMPAAAATVTANYAANAPQTFALTVVNGTGSGNYSAGTSVPIVANVAPTGSVFKQWTGALIAYPTQPSTTVTMPASATTVTATYMAVEAPQVPGPTVLGKVAVSWVSDSRYDVRASWLAVDGATSYLLKLAKPDGSVAVAEVLGTSYTFGGVQKGTSVVTVAAKNTAGVGQSVSRSFTIVVWFGNPRWYSVRQ